MRGFRHSSPNTTTEGPGLVPTVPVGMPSSTLRVDGGGTRTRERPRRYFHAERGNEIKPFARFGVRQWLGGVERGVSPTVSRRLDLSQFESLSAFVLEGFFVNQTSAVNRHNSHVV